MSSCLLYAAIRPARNTSSPNVTELLQLILCHYNNACILCQGLLPAFTAIFSYILLAISLYFHIIFSDYVNVTFCRFQLFSKISIDKSNFSFYNSIIVIITVIDFLRSKRDGYIKIQQTARSYKRISCSTKEHPTADTVYLHVRKTFPKISLGTVYRNLNLLADTGEVLKITTPDGGVRFDATTHSALSCTLLQVRMCPGSGYEAN